MLFFSFFYMFSENVIPNLCDVFYISNTGSKILSLMILLNGTTYFYKNVILTLLLLYYIIILYYYIIIIIRENVKWYQGTKWWYHGTRIHFQKC